MSWDDLFHGIGRLETNPPTFYAIEKLWTNLWGTSDWLLRLPSVLGGIAAVAVVWAITQASFGGRAALWAAAFLAVQPQHLEYSPEARVYSLLFLAVAVAVHSAQAVNLLSERPPASRYFHPMHLLCDFSTPDADPLAVTLAVAPAAIVLADESHGMVCEREDRRAELKEALTQRYCLTAHAVGKMDSYTVYVLKAAAWAKCP